MREGKTYGISQEELQRVSKTYCDVRINTKPVRENLDEKFRSAENSQQVCDPANPNLVIPNLSFSSCLSFICFPRRESMFNLT